MKTSSLSILLIFVSISFALLVLVGLASFIVTLAMQLSARGGGWAELAKRYADRDPPAGEEFARQTVRVGKIRYRHCVQVLIAPQGLGLSAQLKLAMFAPLLIPWNEIKGTQKTRLYGRKAVQLSIGEPITTTIDVYTKLFEAMSPYLTPDL